MTQGMHAHFLFYPRLFYELLYSYVQALLIDGMTFIGIDKQCLGFILL